MAIVHGDICRNIMSPVYYNYAAGHSLQSLSFSVMFQTYLLERSATRQDKKQPPDTLDVGAHTSIKR